MTKKEILDYLEMISSELTDAYHLSDRDSTVDTNYAVSTAQELVAELTHRIENNVTISDKEKPDFDEAMNGMYN